jgi:hypothetical protein
MKHCVSFAAMRRTSLLIIMFLVAGVGGALAQPRAPARMPPTPMPPARMPPEPMPPEPMPPQQVWDSRGWVPLGERTVNGRVDRDRIEVGRYEGKFGKLTVVVENSGLELIDLRIVFGDRTEYHPKLKHVFREGQRTRAIELPPNEAVIRFIEIRYKNVPGGGDARVQVWGLRTGDAVPPPAAPPAVTHSWDTRGWTLLGQRQINGRLDRDRIEVGRYEGRFGKLTMAVEDSDLELIDFRIEFADRTEYHPKLAHFFREGQRTRVIDLPPTERAIRFIDLKYKNTRGGGPASVEVWGFGSAAPAPAPAAWEPRGWTMLGEQRVHGRREATDKIQVRRWNGKFRKLTVVVLDSDLEMIDLSIKFGRGEPFHPEVNQVFRENSRTRVIDLPGDERVIKWIEFTYRNLPGGGRARVQVWAK